MKKRWHPRVEIVFRRPVEQGHQCYECRLLGTERCRQPNAQPSSLACGGIFFLPRSELDKLCPVCHRPGTSCKIPVKRQGKTYVYWAFRHYDRTKKSRHRYCYLGKHKHK